MKMAVLPIICFKWLTWDDPRNWTPQVPCAEPVMTLPIPEESITL